MLAGDEGVRLDEVSIGIGSTVSFDLEPVRILTSDAVIQVVDELGSTRPDVSELKLFRGTVVGEPDSRVFLATSPRLTQGFVEVGGQLRSLASRELDGGMLIKNP